MLTACSIINKVSFPESLASFINGKIIYNPLDIEELIRVKNIGESEFDVLNDVIQRPDGTLLTAGHSSSIENENSPLDNDVTLYYTLSNGSLLSSHLLVGDGLDQGEAIALNSNGDLIVVGSTDSKSGEFPGSKGGKDLFVAIWN